VNVVKKHTYADHPAAAMQCLNQPGVEVLVGVYPRQTGATTVARGITRGRLRSYRPSGAYEASAHPHEWGTAVWARYVDGIDVEPLPKTMTVRVPDYGTGLGYEGVRLATVEISARCRTCGGPRGTARPEEFVRDGVRLVRDAWTNRCGHEDSYEAVLAEVLQDARAARRPKELLSIEGGRYAAAVDLVLSHLDANPSYSAQMSAEMLRQRGQEDAAAAIEEFARTRGTGSSTSGRSAVLYLNHLDREARTAGIHATAGGAR
jgi:hypothetical protein